MKLLVILLLSLASTLSAQEHIATLYSKIGLVEVQSSGGQWKTVSKGHRFFVNDTVRTGEASKAGIRFASGYVTRLGEKTLLEFTDTSQSNDKLSLGNGKAFFFSRNPNKYPIINTPQASASIRGTELSIAVDNDVTSISLLQGAAEVSNNEGAVTLAQLERVVVKTGETPFKEEILDFAGEIQWALRYELLATPAREVILRGEIERAKSILKDTDDSASKAQLALIFIAEGKLDLATEALSNSSGWEVEYAKSFLAQASKDLEGARQFAQIAYRANAEVAPRYAETLAFFGDYEKAKEVLSSSNSAHASQVRGYLHLADNEIDRAIASFEKAGQSGQSYLGLGLAKIKKGDFDSGRSWLEQAVAEEPQVAVFRSYLGKAWFDEENESLAEEEYETAIRLDPEDPTPYLYRSHLKLSRHDPIGALQDIQKSIERNGNRAVYRSSLLLDKDQASRSVSLGRMFSRLGFNELSRVEAMKSLHDDYSNYSAHYLLSDLYRDTHLNDRAQTTENLIGRLLAPVTFNAATIDIGGSGPVNEFVTLYDRPDTKLEIAGDYSTISKAAQWQGDYSTGDNKSSFNFGYTGLEREGFRDNDTNSFHQIFSQAQFAIDRAAQVVFDAAVGFEERGDIVQQFDPQSENGDLDQDVFSTLLRIGYRRDLSANESLLFQTFYNFNRFETEDFDVDTRFPFINVTQDGVSTSEDPFNFDGAALQNYEVDQHIFQSDLQYIKKGEFISLVAGTSLRSEVFDADEEGFITDSGSEQELSFLTGFPFDSRSDIDEFESRTYAYVTTHLTSWADITGGVSFAYVDLSANSQTAPFVDETSSLTSFDPKVGVVLTPFEGTSVRAAFSQTLGRNEVGGIGSIEPTFVGGFNQLFDGAVGTDQTLFGVGVDQKFSNDTFAGISYLRRNLKTRVPFVDGALSFEISNSDVSTLTVPRENLASAEVDTLSAYFYHVLTSSISLASEIRLERFEEDFPFPETETVFFDNQINYFDPSGFFLFVSPELRVQERGGGIVSKTDEDFWIIDAGFGYELAKRKGLFSITLKNILDEDYLYSPVTDERIIQPGFGAEFAFTFRF